MKTVHRTITLGALVALWSLPSVAKQYLPIPAIRFMNGTAPGAVKPLAWHAENFPRIGLPQDNTYPPLPASDRSAVEALATALLPTGKTKPSDSIVYWRVPDHVTRGDLTNVAEVKSMVSSCNKAEVYPMGPHQGAAEKQDALITFRCAANDSLSQVQAGVIVSNGRVLEVFIGYQPTILYDLPDKFPPGD